MAERLLGWARQQPISNRREKGLLATVCHLADDGLSMLAMTRAELLQITGYDSPEALNVDLRQLRYMRLCYRVYQEHPARKRTQGRQNMNHFIVVAQGITPPFWNEYLWSGAVNEFKLREYDLPSGFFALPLTDLLDVMLHDVERVRSLNLERRKKREDENRRFWERIEAEEREEAERERERRRIERRERQQCRLSKKERDRVLEQLIITHRNVCQGCFNYSRNARNFSVAHVKPIGKGGTNECDNSTLLCHGCRLMMSNSKTLEEIQFQNYISEAMDTSRIPPSIG